MAASLAAAMDSHTPKAIGENGHVEHTWSSDIKERIIQLNFQLVRCDKERAEELGNMYLDLLREIKTKMETNCSPENMFLYETIVKLPAITRDLTTKDCGKGEWHLAYVLTERLIRIFPATGKKLFSYFCNDIPAPPKESAGAVPMTPHPDTLHPYGSWKDVKYFWNYVRTTSTEIHDYPFKDYNDYFIHLVNTQLRKDAKSKRPSLLSRWIPRETSQFGWQFKLLAENYFARYLETAQHSKKPNALELAKKKAYMDYSKIFTKISAEKLDTPQVKMCDRNWSALNIGGLTSVTLRNQGRALQNITKAGDTRHVGNADRETCAINFKAFVDSAKKGEVKVKGKRVGVVKFVSDAYELTANASNLEEQVELLNQQWNDFLSQIPELPPMLVMCDTSGSMGQTGPHIPGPHGNTPLLAALGLANLLSQKSVIKDRVLTFSSDPSWIILDGIETFYDRIMKMNSPNWGMDTDFYRAMDRILECAIEQKLSAQTMSEMTLVILSDMQINQAQSYKYRKTPAQAEKHENTMRENMERKYHAAGIEAVGEPYTLPHIFFWNLRSTNGFPTVSSTENTTMCSGFNPAQINALCNKGIAGVKELSPWNTFIEGISSDRYNFLEW